MACCDDCNRGKPCAGKPRVAGVPHPHPHPHHGGRGTAVVFAGPTIYPDTLPDCDSCRELFRRGYCNDPRVAGAVGQAKIARCKVHPNGVACASSPLRFARVGEDISGGFDTPQNRAAIAASAKAAALAVQTGQAPSYENYKAVVTQALVTVAVFAPEIAPFVGAAIAMFYGFEQAMKVFPKASGGGGKDCPSNDCQWCGDFDLKHEWPPKNPDDPRWHHGIPSGVEPLTNLPTANDFERFYQLALLQAWELWRNCKLPIVSSRAILVSCAEAWNTSRQGSPVQYGTTSPLKNWGDEPANMRQFIEEVLSSNYNTIDAAPSPGPQTILMGAPPKYLGPLHRVLAGLEPTPSSNRAGSALGALDGLINSDAVLRAAGLNAGTRALTKEESDYAVYYKKYTGKDWHPR